jgi:hypothetical protein
MLVYLFVSFSFAYLVGWLEFSIVHSRNIPGEDERFLRLVYGTRIGIEVVAFFRLYYKLQYSCGNINLTLLASPRLGTDARLIRDR